MYNIKFLNRYEKIKAFELLYDVYIKELNWKFGDNTPFNLRIHNNMLIDDNSHKGQWIGAFHNNKLIGCLQINSKIKGSVPTQHYQLNNPKLNTILNKQSRLVEINRAAVNSKYRGSVLIQMFRFVFIHGSRYNLTFFFTTCVRPLILLFIKLKMKPISGIKFKYEPHDRHYVTSFLCRPSHKYIIKNIETALKI